MDARLEASSVVSSLLSTGDDQVVGTYEGRSVYHVASFAGSTICVQEGRCRLTSSGRGCHGHCHELPVDGLACCGRSSI